jgi:hypothetical protein
MGQMIQELGLFGYIQKFPVNPITMVCGAIVIGIIVLVINATGKKGKANKYLLENPGSAIMMFHKKNIGNNDYADNIRIVKLNDKIPQWFFIKPMVPAIYLKPGENKIELYADWARGGGVSIKMFKSEIVLITVSAKVEGSYSLEYYIPEKKFAFEPFNLP